MFDNIFWTFPIAYMLRKQYLCTRFRKMPTIHQILALQIP